MIYKNNIILAILLFVYISSILAQNTYLNSIIQNIKGNQDELKNLNESISMRDQDNYVVFALWDWRKGNGVWGMPIIVKQDTILKYPYEKYVKKYFNKPNRYFSVDFGGQASGIIKFDRWPNSSDIKFQLIDIDSVLIKNARNTHQNYVTIASSLFPKSNKRRQFGNEDEKKQARNIAFAELKLDKVIIDNPSDIEVIDVQILNPNGTGLTYIFSVFRYYEKRDKNIQMHYLTLFYPLKKSKPNFTFKTHTQSDSKHYMGPRSYFFLDIIDYDFDGKDEFLLIESGYEHNDVILYKLENNELIEIYRVPTSLS